MLSKILGALGAGWVPYAIGMALLAGLFSYGYHLGADRTEAIWSAKYSQLVAGYTKSALDETTRQADANTAAKEREAVTLAIIAAQSAALAQKQKELSDAADKDPAADSRSLSDDARLRIDSYH